MIKWFRYFSKFGIYLKLMRTLFNQRVLGTSAAAIFLSFKDKLESKN